jgi:hypothetical protein
VGAGEAGGEVGRSSDFSSLPSFTFSRFSPLLRRGSVGRFKYVCFDMIYKKASEFQKVGTKTVDPQVFD